MGANRKDPETRRIRKTETTFKVQLSPEQKEAKAIALENQTTNAGTMKVLLI